jgi:hypothetical protein
LLNAKHPPKDSVIGLQSLKIWFNRIGSSATSFSRIRAVQ